MQQEKFIQKRNVQRSLFNVAIRTDERITAGRTVTALQLAIHRAVDRMIGKGDLEWTSALNF